MEIWKDIEGYEGLYQVSNMGRVKSLSNNKKRKEKILKSSKDGGGYLMVGLCKDGKQKCHKIHRLVASAFLDNPNNLIEVNHINEIKTDNCAENLEWCNRSYNMNYGTRTERIQKPILQFSKTGEFIRKWDSGTQVERELGFDNSSITKCCKNKLKSVGGYIWRYYYKGIWIKTTYH